MEHNNPLGKEGWTPARLSSLEGKTFVITGTTSGAGFEATRILLSKGGRVVMLNRNETRAATAITKLQEEFGKEVQVSNVIMDLSVLDSVRKAAAEVLEIAPQIDALICNAAIAQLAKQEITIDGFEAQLGVNHLGHFLLCGMLFDRIDASNGRFVVVASLAYKQRLKRIKFEDLNFDQNYNPQDAYAQSKLAQMIFAYELQRRVQAAGKNVQVQVCHPGASQTDLIKGDNISRPIRIIWSLVSPLIAQSAEKGAYPEVMCATEDGLGTAKFYGPTKRGETVGPVGECTLQEHALDEDVARKLWEISVEKTSFEWEI